MHKIDESPKRKFLKTIYDIQKSFGSSFGNVSRNFSFGIKPNEEEKIKLEAWFTQVNEAKKQLYNEIYENYKIKPFAYLGASFDYGTFFKGGGSLKLIRTNRSVITSVPVIEGLRMEVNGSIRSFITNHKRIYEENTTQIGKAIEIASENKKIEIYRSRYGTCLT